MRRISVVLPGQATGAHVLTYELPSVRIQCNRSANATPKPQPPTHKTRHNSTNMDPIQEAIEFLELRKAGDNFSYCKTAKMFSVKLSTLV
jgi:hypothetical protein